MRIGIIGFFLLGMVGEILEATECVSKNDSVVCGSTSQQSAVKHSEFWGISDTTSLVASDTCSLPLMVEKKGPLPLSRGQVLTETL